MPTIPPFRLLLSVRSLALVRKSGLITIDCPVSLFPMYGLQKEVQTRDAYEKEFIEVVGARGSACVSTPFESGLRFLGQMQLCQLATRFLG